VAARLRRRRSVLPSSCVYMIVSGSDPVAASLRAGGAGIEEIYRQEWAGAVRLAWLLTGTRWIAEDMAQDAFLAMSQQPHIENPRAYLRAALVNASKSRFRHLEVERQHPSESVPFTLQPEFDDLLVAIRRIPERQRAALILRYYADLSVEEVARAMGCRFATAKSLIQRGLTNLRREVANDD
jgi:RNA polymerase sigma factor (sigma-70 family)